MSEKYSSWTPSTPSPQVSTPNIADLATTRDLVIHMPGGVKVHRGASEKLRSDNNVTRKRKAKVTVDIFQSEHLDEGNRIARTIRAAHKKPTLSGVGKERILMNTLAIEYDETMSAHGSELTAMMEEFFQSLGHLRHKWISEGGKLADNGEYIDASGKSTGVRWPTEDDCRNKFKLDIIPGTIQDVDDIRFGGLPESLRDRFKKDVIAVQERRFNGMITDMSLRVSESLERVVDRMREYGVDESGKTVGKFTDTLIPNVREIAGLLSHFNITKDPNIEEIRRRLVTEICNVDETKLREDPSLRKSLGGSAEDILSRLSSFSNIQKKD